MQIRGFVILFRNKLFNTKAAFAFQPFSRMSAPIGLLNSSTRYCRPFMAGFYQYVNELVFLLVG